MAKQGRKHDGRVKTTKGKERRQSFKARHKSDSFPQHFPSLREYMSQPVWPEEHYDDNEG